MGAGAKGKGKGKVTESGLRPAAAGGAERGVTAGAGAVAVSDPWPQKYAPKSTSEIIANQSMVRGEMGRDWERRAGEGNGLWG